MGKNKWEKMVEKMDLFLLQILSFLLFNEKGGGEGGPPPPSKQQKFLCTPLSSLLLDFLILRPNKNDALGAKVCIVSSVVVVVL